MKPRMYIFEIIYIGKSWGWMVSTPIGNKCFDSEMEARTFADSIETIEDLKEAFK